MADFITFKPKFPDEALDYDVDWSLRLLTGESIATHTAAVVMGSAVAASESIVGGTKQVFWVSGGTAGEEVRVKCEITTDSTPPRTHEVVVRVAIAKPA